MTNSSPLKGQKAIVTGANSGIGKAIAMALGRAGAEVAVNYRDGEDAAVAVVKDIAQGGSRALAIRADVSREVEVKDLFRSAVEQLGTVDILVNNAGLQRDAPFEDMTLEQWNTVIGVNLTGQFLCAREAVREFKRRGVVPAVSRAAGKIICAKSPRTIGAGASITLRRDLTSADSPAESPRSSTPSPSTCSSNRPTSSPSSSSSASWWSSCRSALCRTSSPTASSTPSSLGQRR